MKCSYQALWYTKRSLLYQYEDLKYLSEEKMSYQTNMSNSSLRHILKKYSILHIVHTYLQTTGN